MRSGYLTSLSWYMEKEVNRGASRKRARMERAQVSGLRERKANYTLLLLCRKPKSSRATGKHG